MSFRLPEVGVINALRWRPHPWGDDLREQAQPELVQPRATLFEQAASTGVSVRVISAAQFAGSGLTRAVLRGGRYVGVHAIGDLAAAVTTAIGAGGFCYGYHADLDLVGHLHGPGSHAWRVQLRQIDRLVESLVEALPSGGLLAVVADHGMVTLGDDAVDADAAEPLHDGVTAIGGEIRARHVYTRAGAVADVAATWREYLGPRAWVRTREEAIAADWFGTRVADDVRCRIGDVVVAARGSSGVLRRTAEPVESSLIGQHGSLTPAEQRDSPAARAPLMPPSKLVDHVAAQHFWHYCGVGRASSRIVRVCNAIREACRTPWRNVPAVTDFGRIRDPLLTSGRMFALATLLTLVNQVSGTPYISGGDSPAGTDCSGLVSWVTNAATGRPVYGDRFNTGNIEGELRARGFEYGTRPRALVVGWNSGHTAVTLPDGTPVASGEGGGGVKIGGGGAYQPQFSRHMFLPMPADVPPAPEPLLAPPLAPPPPPPPGLAPPPAPVVLMAQDAAPPAAPAARRTGVADRRGHRASLCAVIVLLPPSETKRAGGDGPALAWASLSAPALTPVRAELVDELVTLAADREASRRALGLSAAQDAEIDRNAALRSAPTAPAVHRYTGVLYDSLDVHSLHGRAAARAAARLAVVSALFGLVRADDPIPAYRLSATSRLPGRPTLAARWRPALEPVLAEIAARELIVDLRSGSYAALGKAPNSVHVEVVAEHADGRRATVSHFNKAHKGRLARALATTRSEPDDAAAVAAVARRAGMRVERRGEHLTVVVPA